MSFSNLERQIFKKGYRVIAGIDEAGRGPLAGPVVAAIVAVIHNRGLSRLSYLSAFFREMRKSGLFPKGAVRDSKSFTAKQREIIFRMITDEPSLEWRVSAVWPKVIDRINIWQATLLAWRRCLQKLNHQPDFLFLDGQMELLNFRQHQKAIIQGDQKILLLSLASVIAKIHRDRLMTRLDKKYPAYGFRHHKGYGTKRHLERLRLLGPCPIHRKSFRPVFENLAFQDRVYYIVSQIPRGQTMTYQQVAQKAGCPRAYRAVGNILNKNTDPNVPCHRVIRSNQQIGGYRYGSALKADLLQQERGNCQRTVLWQF